MSRFSYDKTTQQLDLIAGVPIIDALPTQNSNNVVSSGGVYITLSPLTATLAQGATSVIIQDSRIKTTSTILPVSETFGLAPESVTVTTGQVVMTYTAQAQAENVGVLVF